MGDKTRDSVLILFNDLLDGKMAASHVGVSVPSLAVSSGGCTAESAKMHT